VVQTTRQPAAVARWSRDSLLRQGPRHLAQRRLPFRGNRVALQEHFHVVALPGFQSLPNSGPHPEPERLNRVRNKLALARDRDVDLEPAGCIGRSAKSATRKYNPRAGDRGPNQNCCGPSCGSDKRPVVLGVVTVSEEFSL